MDRLDRSNSLIFRQSHDDQKSSSSQQQERSFSPYSECGITPATPSPDKPRTQSIYSEMSYPLPSPPTPTKPCFSHSMSFSAAAAVNDKKKEDKKKTSITMTDALIILSLCSNHFCHGTVYAVLAPFLPAEAEAKGVSASEYGLIFGVFALGQLFCYPLAAVLVPILTAKGTIVGGMFLTTICTTGFAYLEWCPEGSQFFWVAFLLRLLSAVGVAFSLTAILTFSLSRFKERITVVAAFEEASFYAGMVISPGIGGVLYEWGGFATTFFVVGGVCFACFLLVLVVIPADTVEKDKEMEAHIPLWSLATKSGIFINLLMLFVSFANVGCVDATLTSHLLEDLDLSPSSIGGVFLLTGLVALVLTPVWGCAIQRFGHPHAFSVICFLLWALSFLLSGPMFPLNFEPTVGLAVGRQVLQGLATGPHLMAPLASGVAEMTRYGYPENTASKAAFSALYNSAYAIGAAVGPSAGGFLLESVGFEKLSTVMFAVQILMIVIIVAFNAVRYCNGTSSGIARKTLSQS